MDFRELINDYLDDAGVHLEEYDRALMVLEGEGLVEEVVRGVLGSLHTLKGNSGMMGFESLKTYVHEVEGVLKRVLDGTAELDAVLGVLFESANVIRRTLGQIQEKPDRPLELGAETEVLRVAGSAGKSGKGGKKGKSSRGGKGKNIEDKSAEPVEFERRELPLDAYLGTKTDTIKVDFKRLDELLNLVGELVIFKTRLGQMEERVRLVLEDKGLKRELGEVQELMGRTVSQIQEGIMRVRMLPVRAVFSRFNRMVRDIAEAGGKRVVLEVSGEDTELDKTVIDELGEPLLHMIRNAVDHGIEVPEERTAAGKPAVGLIRLTAIQESNYVIIKVGDDGRGIDMERVRAKAVSQGLFGEDEVVDEEALSGMIFRPGFSTKEESTEISGRGIGLDVVSRNIMRLNGQVTVESALGRGSEFTIKLPLSLAIIPALMAEVGAEVYAIPMNAVEETLRAREGDVHEVNGREVVRLRESVIPVVRRRDFFGINGAVHEEERFYLVVVGRGEKRIGLAVDRLRGQQEIVIKAMDETFGRSRGVAGASILGDGRIVLIIDVLAFWGRERKEVVENA